MQQGNTKECKSYLAKLKNTNEGRGESKGDSKQEASNEKIPLLSSGKPQQKFSLGSKVQTESPAVVVLVSIVNSKTGPELFKEDHNRSCLFVSDISQIQEAILNRFNSARDSTDEILIFPISSKIQSSDLKIDETTSIPQLQNFCSAMAKKCVFEETQNYEVSCTANDSSFCCVVM